MGASSSAEFAARGGRIQPGTPDARAAWGRPTGTIRTMQQTAAESRRAALARLVDHPAFNQFVIFVIVLNAALIGIGTYTEDPSIRAVLVTIEWVCVAVFVAEFVLRFLAREFFRRFVADGWNVFDFVIIVAALIPQSGGVGPLLRILRVFRVLRLVKTIPELRLIVNVLLKSVASMKYIGLLAIILFYVYAVIGVKLFGLPPNEAAGAPGHPLFPYFSSIHEACFTLFRILTGDDWTQMRYELEAAGAPTAAFTIYQVSWILIATFLLVNLIVGAIINNYQQVQEIEQHRSLAPDSSDRRLRELVAELDAIVQVRRVHADQGGLSGTSRSDTSDRT